jgi:hypothetical protein
MKERKLWVIVNIATGTTVERLGTHGSRKSAQAMLDAHLEAFEVNLKPNFEVREKEPDKGA